MEGVRRFSTFSPIPICGGAAGCGRGVVLTGAWPKLMARLIGGYGT